ncbi:hypothetical protein [Nitrincola alkalilacustris]|uniref:hypothetical protein n=1 Tax=Nitrincola alkalilacustris TaxID=1571224 RepID=UPI00124CBCBA|nr:hypothetical protein [Nitrincola alkalilacustris]
MKKSLIVTFLVIAIIAAITLSYSSSAAKVNSHMQLAFSEVDLGNILLALLERHRRLNNRLYDTWLSLNSTVASTLIGDIDMPFGLSV